MINDLSKLIERATVGDVNAIIELIDYYLANNEVNKARLEAERLKYLSSAEGYRKLAVLSLKGSFDKANIEEAKAYFEKAYDLGDVDSGYNLALLYIKENKVNTAIPYLTSGVSNNHTPSIKLLASLYLKGEGVSKDLIICLSLLKKAYELGDESVVSAIGKVCYQLGEYDSSFKYFTLGMHNHDLDAIYHLGLCYAKGLGIKQDLEKSRFYYEMGANMNEPNCLYNLSLYYRNGIGVAQNIPLADKLLDQAIAFGFKK